jgi:hypothetical protein
MFVTCESSVTDAQVQSLAAWASSNSKIAAYKTLDTDTVLSSSTTDLGSVLYAASSSNVFGIYTEHDWSTVYGYPHAQELGILGAFQPGTVGPEWWALSNIYTSSKALDGSADLLTTSEKSVLEGKNVNYVTKVGGYNVMPQSLTAGGYEIRVLLGAYYSSYRIALGLANLMLSSNFIGFNDEDLGKVEDIVRYWLNWGVDNKFILDDYTINIPKAATISSATKATHTYTNTTIYIATINTGIFDFVLRGTLQT